MEKMRSIRNEKGFTLVELAIVLVIIGILLGGIIKGQELIKNAKYKRLYSTYREMVAAVYSYYDKYGKYPGDDNTAATRWTGVGAVNGNGNGYIDSTAAVWCVAGTAGENCLAWQDLRLANILSGASNGANSRIAPNHPFGGRIAVLRLDTATMGMTGWQKPVGICFEYLNNETARWLDTTYDDGVYNTGSIRGNADYVANPADAVTAQYTCIEG
jgi:prepilin-type N-terminal cleavage/methylation domain-containing protein